MIMRQSHESTKYWLGYFFMSVISNVYSVIDPTIGNEIYISLQGSGQ